MEEHSKTNVMPFEAELILTLRCNLSCPFCFEGGWDKSHREISADDWLSIIDELAEMQVIKVGLTGGEPLVSPAFLPILDRIQRYKMRFKVLTNGTLMDQKTVDAVAKSGKCNYVQISLDGFPEQNNAIRGRDGFEKSVAAVKMLAEAGVPVHIRSTFSKLNCAGFPDFLEFLNTLPISEHSISPVLGNAPAEIAISYKELAKLAVVMLNSRDRFPKLHHNTFPRKMIKALRDRGEHPNGITCLASKTTISVFPDGSVVPCEAMPYPVAGYAVKQPLKEIWRSQVLEEFRTRGKIPPFRPDECPSCPWRGRCLRFCLVQESIGFCYKRFYNELVELGWRP